MNERYHIVRQCILQALKYFKRTPAAPASIVNCHICQAEGVTLQEVVDESAKLQTAGYVANLKPGRGILLQLTEKGLKQIDCEEQLEEFIWGERAFFQ
jgi:DNA-binding MarR family transcriptional regulator